MKPFDELLALSPPGTESAIARRLTVSPAYVIQWRPRPRRLPDGRTIIESGCEPSPGFVAASLAILRGG